MKYLVFFLLLFSWFRPQPFTIVSAEYQSVFGGRRESGIATTYTIKLVARYDSDRLQIEDLWVDTSFYPVRPYKRNTDLSFSQSWQKGDTIYLTAVKRSYPDDNKVVKDFNGLQKPVPHPYNGAALIGYRLKGKQKYFVVNDLAKVQDQYMP